MYRFAPFNNFVLSKALPHPLLECSRQESSCFKEQAVSVANRCVLTFLLALWLLSLCGPRQCHSGKHSQGSGTLARRLQMSMPCSQNMQLSTGVKVQWGLCCPGFQTPRAMLPINSELRPWDCGFANDPTVSSGIFYSYKWATNVHLSPEHVSLITTSLLLLRPLHLLAVPSILLP